MNLSDDPVNLIGVTPDSRLELGNMPSGSELLLLVKNAMEHLNKGQVLEVVSTNPYLKDDLKGWCKLHKAIFLNAFDGGDQFRLFIQKKRNAPGGQPDWGHRIPLRKGERFDTRDWLQGRLGDFLEQAPTYFGFVPRGAVAETGVPDFGFTLNKMDEVWSDNLLDLYEQSKENQWNATTDIPWGELPDLPK
jgi:TusA-related sulfurtransferase